MVRFAPSPTGFFHVGGRHARPSLTGSLPVSNGGQVHPAHRGHRSHPLRTGCPARSALEGLRWLGLATGTKGPEVGGAYGPYFSVGSRCPSTSEYARQALVDCRRWPIRCYCSAAASWRPGARRAKRAAGVQPMGYDRPLPPSDPGAASPSMRRRASAPSSA